LPGRYDLVDEDTSIFGISDDESLLAYVGCKLVTRHLHQLASQFREHEGFILWFSLLKYELDDIVLQEASNLRSRDDCVTYAYPKLVLHEIHGILVKFIQ
jgi:hypothetical protein